jgi:prepilin-type N-terminal cleavage/methylation domain-containing protein
MKSACPLRIRAFSLLEVVLALALFGLAAVGLMGALNEVCRHTVETVEETWITEKLRSLLTESACDPGLEPGEFVTDPDRSGIAFRVAVEPLDLRSAAGAPLQDILRVRAEALRGGEILAEAETWRYLPLFQNP